MLKKTVINRISLVCHPQTRFGMTSYLLKILFYFMLMINISYAADNYPPRLSLEVLQAPTPMIADGKSYLVYEFYLTNYYHTPITLTGLEVGGPEATDLKFKFAAQEFNELVHSIGVKDDKAPFVFQPGISKMIYMWLPFQTLTVMPNQLIHKVTFDVQDEDKMMTSPTMTSEPLLIKKNLPIVVSPPLKGDYWLAGNGPSNTSEHRKANLVVNGHDYFAQRYAIDFVQLGADGLTYQGDEHKNTSYHSYGKDIQSVAPGKVVELKDGIPENVPNSGKTAVTINMDTVGGNFLLIDIGHGAYAFYAHLIPGSLKVKVGDKVARGQVLAKLGNSGNSTEPHLHFHIVDKAAVLGANGIPYAFDNFYLRHSESVSKDAIKIKIIDTQLKHELNELVLENAVIKFPD